MKKIKTFTVGLIVGLLLTTSAFASNNQIQAMFADLKLSVNGESKQLKSKPIVYNGSTYLPLREVADLLGYNVDYKSATKLISLDDKDVKPKSSTDNTVKESEYKIGDKAYLGDFEFTVNDVEYAKSVGNNIAHDGKIFAIVNFEMFTKSVHKYDPYWRANQFIYRFGTKDDEITRINSSTEESISVYPNKQNKVMVYTIIDSDQKLTSITFYNPITDETMKVDLN